jgi:hypothetical protein
MEVIMDDTKIVFLTVIAGRKIKQELVNSLAEFGCTLFDVMYGSGFVKGNDFLAAFGFVDNGGKVIITSLTNGAKVDKIFEMLNTKFNFDRPNTGIAFTVPVSNLTY